MDPSTGSGQAQALIRNFCIIAHIDHGKSTLADRMLELTGTIPKRQMSEQVLDQMDLERERASRSRRGLMTHAAADGVSYELNRRYAPRDFTYEVSRALAAAECAVLVVDASQGIEAQTLANVYMAMEQNVTIIPVVNKIDLPAAEPERVAQELVETIGFARDDVLFVSAKEGTGVPELLEAIVRRAPPPAGDPAAPLRALIFDPSTTRTRA
jgi:GTP-binding protein LepA